MTDHDTAGTASLVSGTADAARARMTADLRARSRSLSEPIQEAFATVPRHLFVPEVGPSAAYRDEAFVIKCGPDGIPVSSSSQPAMMAIMLEQLGLQAGHRVLEIGTGSGYNAALISVITAPRGKVVSLDIDLELVERARSSLAAAGFSAVEVRCADGGYGDPAGAPFDRVIVTAGVWDIAPAWLEQLADDGRLVLPLSVRGVELSVGLRRADAGWHSTSACRCGFVRMLGAFAGPQAALRLEGREPMIGLVADGAAADVSAVRAALAGPVADLPTGLAVTDQSELGDLDLWLTLTEPQLDRLTVLSPVTGWTTNQSLLPPLLPLGGLLGDATDPERLGIAALLPGTGTGQAVEVGMRGYGPGGEALAEHLAARALWWHELGRPGVSDLRLSVYPAGIEAEPAAGMLMLDRPSASIAVGWPDRG
jgi:protein-L-isoaspartate(D-aspartate) O-methyltransferase